MARAKRGETAFAHAIRDHFLAWQCRIRQVAMREQGGRPSPGMRPRVLDASGRELAPALTVLLIPKEPEESTAFFRYQVMKTPDPRDVYERALTFLQADYFQDPETFSDRLVTVLSSGASLAASLLDEGDCMLEFDQGDKATAFLEVRDLKPGMPLARQRSGTIVCSIPPCPTRCMCSSSNRTGLRHGPIRRRTP